MKKKFLLTMLVISMLTLMGSGKLSAQNVAKIGTTEYATLQDAVDAAEDGQTITLLQNVNISTGTSNYDRVLIKGKTLTIDLNGCIVSADEPEDDVFRIEGIAATGSSAAVGANVTFTSSKNGGTIKHSSCGIISRGENAENVIVLDGVTIDDDGGANHSAIYHNGTNYGCTLTIKNSTISSQLYGLFISGSNSWGDKLNNVRIENSTITSTIDEYQDSDDEGTAVEVKQGNIYVTNSTITANSPMISMSNNASTGGTCSSGYAIALTNNGTNEVSKGECTISGNCEITGAVGIKAGNGGTDPINNNENAEILIYGGTFTTDVTKYLANGYKYENGTVSLTAGGVAQIEGTKYQTLQAAVGAADDQTIELLADVNISTGTENYDRVLIKGKTLTIDLNGYKVSANDPEDDVFRIEGIAATGSSAAVGANVTFIDSDEDKKGKIKHSSCGIISRGENAENVIVLDGVTIDDGGDANHSAIYHNGTNYGCTLTIKNSTISSQYYGLFISGSNSWGDKLNNVRIENSTIKSTTVKEEGSAVEVKQGNLYVTSSTITKNTKLNASFNNNSNGTCSSGYAIALTNNGTNEVSKGECTISGSSIIHGQIGIKAGNGGTGPIENNENAEILIYGGNITDCSIIGYYLASGYKYDNNTATVTPEADGVAQIEGNDPSSTLQEAVDEAENGQTITLLADVNISTGTSNYDHVLIKGKTLTIDLNGYKVSANDPEDDVFRIEGIAATEKGDAIGANVTFIDSDEAKNGRIEHSSCAIYSRGENAENKIVLNGVTIDDEGGANHSAIYHNGTNYGCTLTIENSTISSQLYGLFISGSTSWGDDKFNEVIIKNSTITSTIDEYQDSADEGTAVEIKRGNLTVENSTITANSPKINMSNNGNGTCSSGFAIALTNNGTEASSGTVTINSGTFEGAIGIKGEGGTVIGNTETATISISGGTFSNENLPEGVYTTLLDGYCADGYELQVNEDGTYGVVTVEDLVAKIVNGATTTYYASLKAAVEAASTENTETVTLLQSSSGSGVVINKSITIDFNDKTYSFTEPAVGSQGTTTNGFQILKNNDVVLKNGTLKVNESYKHLYYILIQNYANLTIEDMHLDGTNLDKYSTSTNPNDGDSYVLSNNCGEVLLTGTTSIQANDESVSNPKRNFALDSYDYTSGGYETTPIVTVNTTGAIIGAVSVSAELHLEAVGDESNITRIDMSGDGQLYHYEGFSAKIRKEVAAYNSETKENWATISSPIGDVGLSNVSGLITDGNTYGLYRYNEGQELWENKLATEGFNTLESGRGYIYANSNGTDIIFDGTFNTGTKEVTLTNDGDNSYDGFNLIGNPFTHAIDNSHFTLTEGAALAEGFYVMGADGAWVTKTNAGTSKIGAMESVFVKTNKGTKLTIYKNAVSKSRGENNGMLEINVANAKYNDVAYVSFNKGLGLDKIAHRNDEIPMVYVPVNGTDYAIAMMNKDVTEIPVSFMAMTMGEYTFSAKAIDCEFEQMYLVDRMTGVETNLLLEDYTFMAKSGDNAERFIIRMENSANANTNTENFVFVNNDELIFNNIAGEGIIRIIDVLGRPVAEYNVFGSANISTTSFRSGVYMIQMSDENGVKVQKIIVD